MTKIKQYIDLVFTRDSLQKEQVDWGMAYFKEFGQQILENFELKIECIKTKKMIAFCQERQNRCIPILKQELDSRINIVMQEYYNELNEINNLVNAEDTPIAEVTVRKIKKLYHELAKKLHPDLNPEVSNNEKLSQLWQEVVLAYRCNNYDRLVELAIVINDEIDHEQTEEVANLDEKIAVLLQEIETIKTTDPYLYKFLLEDDDMIDEKRQELIEQKEYLQQYIQELQEELSNFEVIELEN